VSILGREAELARISSVLASSTKTRAARAVRIVAPSGFGKTALLEAALAQAPPAWLRAEVTCHHIQSSLPFFAARRTVQALVEVLGGEAERYTSGLDLDREQPEIFEESFYRILEGLTLDHPLLLAFDDAQWADRESCALIERCVRALADRPIALISTERSEDLGTPAFDFRDEAIALNELSDDAAQHIAKNLYPEASDEVIAAITERSAGRAVDLITLSEGAREQRASTARDVDLSLRRTIARDLALVDTKLREFLQICSLIEDPIELPILATLWPEDGAVGFISAASGRFLLQREDGLHFVHDAIKQSVRETIAIAIPLRRRIIVAIQSQPKLRFEDYERVAEQAAGCGDREQQRAALMQLGEEAINASVFSLAASAWERALEIAPPASDEIVPFYTRLSMMYNGTGRESENIRICSIALEAARSSGIAEGTAALVTSLIMAQWLAGNISGARADLERYRREYTSETDRAQILGVEAFISMTENDGERLEAIAAEVEAMSAQTPPAVAVRLNTFRSYVASRSNRPDDALRAVRAADDAAIGLPMLRTMPIVATLHHTFIHGGPSAVEPLLANRNDERASETLRFFSILSRISLGETEDALSLISEALVRQQGVFVRRRLLGLRILALALAFPDHLTAVQHDIAAEIAAFQTGDESSALVPIVCGWLVRESVSNPKRAKTMLVRLLDRLKRGLDPMTFPLPVLLSVSARNIGDRALLERVSRTDGISSTQDPWSVAHHLLGRGAALAFLGTPEASALLGEAKERFGQLGATYFAGLADLHMKGGLAQAARSNGQFGTTTRREREIAGLVAEGLTNREIAEKLVLSERTIEGHMANLFGKLDVSSRTQVAAWYLRATSSVAS